MLDNLREIWEHGVAELVELEKFRWTCPECGYILSMHRDRCLHCVLPW